MTRRHKTTQAPPQKQHEPVASRTENAPGTAVVTKPSIVPVTQTANEPSTAVVTFSELENIPQYRQCPLCWERARGVGVSYSKQGCTRYYKCKRTLTDDAPCGFTWSAIVRTEIVRVEHRIVTLEER